MGERMRRIGWWEEYKCGCVSGSVRLKRDLLGYCPTHGADSRGAQPDLVFSTAHQARALQIIAAAEHQGEKR